MRAYSVDLRRRVIGDCDAGMGTKAVAEKYSVSPSWVRKLKQQKRDTGSIEPITATPGPRPALRAHEGRLRGLIRANPDRTAGEYRALLGVDVAVITVWRAIRRLGFTHKKSAPRGRAGPARRGREAGEVAVGGGPPAGRAQARVPR
jgi:transposase